MIKKTQLGKKRKAIGASSEEKLNFEVRSLSALRDFARFRPRQIRRIYCSDQTKMRLMQECEGLTASHFANASGLLPSAQDKLDFSHAELEISTMEEEEFLSRVRLRERDLVLVLDQVQDPRNLGAIMRSAAFFGIKEVIVAKKRQVLLTPASVATSQAAFALCDLVAVTNISRTLSKLKTEGYWVLAATQGGSAPETIQGKYEKMALVMGSEGAGISPNIQKISDLSIGISGAEETLESLNVGVAAGILLRALHLDQKKASKVNNP